MKSERERELSQEMRESIHLILQHSTRMRKRTGGGNLWSCGLEFWSVNQFEPGFWTLSADEEMKGGKREKFYFIFNTRGPIFVRESGVRILRISASGL